MLMKPPVRVEPEPVNDVQVVFPSELSLVDGLLFDHPEDMELLRCTSTSQVLKSLGDVLGSSTSAKDEFARGSRQVGNVGIFISHNWSISRWDKVLVLLFHVNGWPSMTVAMAMSACCFVAVSSGMLPTFKAIPVVNERDWDTSCWCLLTHMVVYFVSLVCFHEVASLVGYRGRRCFLDKSCVSQVDEEKKRRAIRSLAAFVYYSDDLLVIYTETYLTRLWTVYEMATFLLLHPGGRATVRPPLMAKLLLMSTCVIYVQFISIFATRLQVVREYAGAGGGFNVSLFLGSAFCAIALLPISYLCACEQSKMEAQIEGFSVARADCRDEEDRALVTRNITEFMKHGNFVHSDTSTEEALLAFDSIVRSRLPSFLATSFGPLTAPYDLVLLAGGAAWGYMLDILAGDVLVGSGLRTNLATVVCFAEVALCNIPLCFTLLFYLGRRLHALEASCFGGRWFWPLACVIFAGYNSGSNALGVFLMSKSYEGHPVWLALQAGWLCAELLVVRILFRAPPRERHRRHMQLPSSSSSRGTRSGSLRLGSSPD
jgi:hypothetical protein